MYLSVSEMTDFVVFFLFFVWRHFESAFLFCIDLSGCNFGNWMRQYGYVFEFSTAKILRGRNIFGRAFEA